jgi:hypothetical protein
MNDLLGILVKVSVVMFRIDLILMKALNGMVVGLSQLKVFVEFIVTKDIHIWCVVLLIMFVLLQCWNRCS